jgi:class 3 adenylate cyclase
MSQAGESQDRTPERKVVSVLFVDLVGFTPLSERLDAEDVATIQSAYFEAVRTVVSRHGGIVEKYIGDAVMAVFGVPRVREDDAARAVAAGLALTGAVHGIATSLGLPSDALAIRVAVNSGEVVQAATPSTESGLVTGDVVNVAARLQSEADPGRVLVGPLTALLAVGAAELEPPRRVSVKGKSEPLAASHVRAMRPAPSREHAMGSLRAPRWSAATRSSGRCDGRPPTFRTASAH